MTFFANDCQPMNTSNLDEWEEEEDSNPSATRLPDELLINKYRQSQLKVVRTSVDFPTDQLVRMINEEQINMSPLYQRRNRWDQKQKSRLIESLLLNIPIPPIYLFESDYGNYEVMDGRQRLEALNDFLTDELRLKDLEYWTEIEGFKYSQLPYVLQQGIRRRTVGAIILLTESNGAIEKENDVRMILFERLNTGGVKLNPQELRNALYQGPFNDLVVELSTLPDFRRAWEIPSESDPKLSENTLYSSMGDCDLVLRFFAIREVMLGLRTGSLRQLLDGCARDNQFLPRDSIEELRSVFTRSLKTVTDIFNVNTFRLPHTGRLSKSVFDASMVAVALNPGRPYLPREDVIRNLADIANQHQIAIFPSSLKYGPSSATQAFSYATLVGRGNTPQAIRDRVELFSNVIFGS